MSAGAIIAIVVVVAIVLAAVVFLLPRVREGVRVKKRERELQGRRQQVAGEHRQVADTRARQAEAAERRARMAEQEARRERAEADLQRERAEVHEQGMADHELIDEDEREHFAGTSAMEGPGEVSAGTEETRAARTGETERTSAYEEGRRAAREPRRDEDFRAGREDEEGADESRGFLARFRRDKDREPAHRD